MLCNIVTFAAKILAPRWQIFVWLWILFSACTIFNCLGVACASKLSWHRCSTNFLNYIQNSTGTLHIYSMLFYTYSMLFHKYAPIPQIQQTSNLNPHLVMINPYVTPFLSFFQRKTTQTWLTCWRYDSLWMINSVALFPSIIYTVGCIMKYSRRNSTSCCSSGFNLQATVYKSRFVLSQCCSIR